jgi:polyhydroxybutyrate depolymerase
MESSFFMLKQTCLFFLGLALSSVIQGQTDLPDSIRHDGLSRQYILHRPPGADTLGQLPLVLTLHGGGGSAASAINFTQLNPVADQHGFLAVYPQGYTALPQGGFAWADGRGTQADLSGIDDVGFLLRLLDTLIAAHAIDTSRIYLNGFSNGGFMTQRMACEAPERFAAMASLGCTMDTSLFARCEPGRPLPMLLLMGTADPFVPYEGGPMNGPVLPVVAMDRLVDFWSANNGCQTSLPPVDLPDLVPEDNCTATRFDRTDCTCGADVRLFRINGGGHTWPGVELPAYELIAGETNEDIQASAELWAFFRQYITPCDTLVSIQEPVPKNAPALRIFPNPARATLHLQADAPIRAVRFTDLTGRRRPWIELHAPRASLPLEDLPAGLYGLNIRMQDGSLLIRQIVVQ